MRQNPLIDELQLVQNRWSTDLEAMKCSSGFVHDWSGRIFFFFVFLFFFFSPPFSGQSFVPVHLYRDGNLERDPVRGNNAYKYVYELPQHQKWPHKRRTNNNNKNNKQKGQPFQKAPSSLLKKRKCFALFFQASSAVGAILFVKLRRNKKYN